MGVFKRAGAAAAAVVAVVLALPGTVHAATTTLTGTVSSTSWTNYDTIRSTALATTKFKPTDLIKMSDNSYYLALRMLRADGTVLTNPVYWFDDYTQKNLQSNIATGTKFRMSAAGYGGTSDRTWGGTLTY